MVSVRHTCGSWPEFLCQKRGKLMKGPAVYILNRGVGTRLIISLRTIPMHLLMAYFYTSGQHLLSKHAQHARAKHWGFHK